MQSNPFEVLTFSKEKTTKAIEADKIINTEKESDKTKIPSCLYNHNSVVNYEELLNMEFNDLIKYFEESKKILDKEVNKHNEIFWNAQYRCYFLSIVDSPYNREF